MYAHSNRLSETEAPITPCDNIQCYTTCTFDPHISSCCDGKDEEEEDEDKGLHVIGRHSLHAKENGPQQFALQERKTAVRLDREGGGRE